MPRLILFLLGTVLTGQPTFAQSPAPLTVATYNLRYNNKGDGVNAWPNRKENVKALIAFHEFDLFGTQEGLRGQLTDIAELKEYSFLGAGRDDGKEAGEHSAIFYRKDRFRVLTSGNFWLSETPDKPGKGWDAIAPAPRLLQPNFLLGEIQGCNNPQRFFLFQCSLRPPGC